MTELRVFLVDDHTLLLEALRGLIEEQPDMCVIGEAEDGHAALREIPRAAPDVVVMDISMPRLNGADATRRIKGECPKVQVLALTAHEETGYVQLLLDAGASGYLMKRAAAADLVRAIRTLASGEVYLDIPLARELQARSEPIRVRRERSASDLSERESDVLRRVALGYSMKSIAEVLGLSPRTLETYKNRGMAKLELENRADIVRYALQRGWLKDA